MALDAAKLAQIGETVRARRGNDGKHEVNWIVEGYSLGFLTAEEAKVRFSNFIDGLEQHG